MGRAVAAIWLAASCWIATAEAKPAKTAFNATPMGYGTTWWCTRDLAHHPCWRTKAQCTKSQGECVEQKQAFAYSVRLSDEDFVFVHDSQKVCDAQRKAFIAGEPDLTSASACTRVAAKAPPPPTLPPGKGFWCHSYTVKTLALSVCERDKQRCIASYESKATGVQDSKMNAPVQSWMECTKHGKAWAWLDGDGTKRWYSPLAVEKAHCEALRKGAGEPCREVK